MICISSRERYLQKILFPMVWLPLKSHPPIYQQNVYICFMRASLLAIFSLLFTVYACAQQPNTTNIRLSSIQQIKNDSARLDSLYTYTRKVQDEEPREALNAAGLLLQEAERQGNKLMAANAHFEMGLSYESLSDYPKSLKHYLAALQGQKELGLYLREVTTTLGIARVYDAIGDIASERKYVEAAMALCNEHKNDKRVNSRRAEVLGYLATLYKIEGRYDTSISIYKQSIDLAKETGDQATEMSSICNMAIALKSNKNYEASLAAYKQALALADTTNDLNAYAILSDNMAILFYNMGDYERSEAYSNKTLALAQKLNATYISIDAYDNLKNTYQKEGKYKEAFDAFSKWSILKDSLFNEQKSRQIKELQARYDLDAKDKEIALQHNQISFNRKVNLFLVVISFLLLLIGALAWWNQRRILQRNRIIEAEKKRSEGLLLNILPGETATELMDNGFARSHKYELVTVMFVDFVGFTITAEQLSAEDLVDRIDKYFRAFDNIILKHGLEKIKTIGDSYMCAGGLPVKNESNPTDVLLAAMDILQYVNSDESGKFFNVRIGINSGPLIAGVVGRHKFQYDIWGDTVNVAARMEEHSEPGHINISGNTYELVKGSFDCSYRGKIKVKNKGELDMYFVNGLPAS